MVFDSLTSHQKIKQTKKSVVKIGPPLAKLSGSAHVVYVSGEGSGVSVHMRGRALAFADAIRTENLCTSPYTKVVFIILLFTSLM